MKEVTVQELKRMLEENQDFMLIDVRENYEFEEANLGGKLIPMGEVAERMDEIPRDKKVIVHCKSGGRSGTIINFLETEAGYDNLYNLKGGIVGWMNEIGELPGQEK